MIHTDQPIISVIIPALNEEKGVREAIASATSAVGVQVIVADGGSTDGTVRIARACGVSVVTGQAGRALQMNAAAATARGSILLFLHADTQLPKHFDQAVRSTLGRTGVVAGAFRLAIDAPRPALRWMEIAANLRSRLLQLPYGDQAIFVRTDTFERMRGFAAVPAMEDYEFICRLRRIGRVGLCPNTVKTSARRWLTQGVWRTAVVHQLMVAGYHLGVSPDRLAGWRQAGGDTPQQPSAIASAPAAGRRWRHGV